MARRVLRVAALFVGVLLLLLAGYAIWSPGVDVRDGRHDLGSNGIWISHAWLGADEWFLASGRQGEADKYRRPERIRRLASILREHRITDVFPHLCPATEGGSLPPVDAQQTERFLDEFDGIRVMPWIGGVMGFSARPDDAAWRAGFVASAKKLLAEHPRLAGVHLNIEPCPSGDRAFLKLLDEARAALPDGRKLSVAAYPPPTRLHPFPEVHWGRDYYGEVAARCDQLVVMMYDTSLRSRKLYVKLVAGWTREVLAWSGSTEVLLGLPAYDDEGAGYHDPRVENLENALSGLHAGLRGLAALPPNYRGVALYSEWEMDDAEWARFESHFSAPRARPSEEAGDG